MILVLRKGISDKEIEELKKVLEGEGCRIKEIRGVEETVLGVVGTVQKDLRYFENLEGDSESIPYFEALQIGEPRIASRGHDHTGR